MNITLKIWGSVIIIIIVCGDISKMEDLEDALINMIKFEVS